MAASVARPRATSRPSATAGKLSLIIISRAHIQSCHLSNVMLFCWVLAFWYRLKTKCNIAAHFVGSSFLAAMIALP